MGHILGATELSKSLVEAGHNLLKPHSSTDATLSLLDKMESLLATVEQDPIPSVQSALIPSMKALVSADLLRNPDSDVRVSVISCLTEIMRITAPEAPYNDDQMKEIFQVTVEAFGKLSDASSRSYKKAEVILETVSKVRASLVMLDLECDDIVLEMFRQFLKIIRLDHPVLVLLSMEMIMMTVIDEIEEVPMDLLEILLTSVKKDSQDVSPAALMLVEKVLGSCARKLQPCIMEALKSTGTSLDMYSPVVSSIFQSESAANQKHDDVVVKEFEADEKMSEEQVVPSDPLEGKLKLRISRKGNRSKRTARGGTRRANGDDKVITGNEGQSESTDAETASGSKRKRGRKPNSLMNPEEGYTFKTSSSKKVQEKELEDSSLGKVVAKKPSLPAKRKRNRTKMEETNHDAGSIHTPPSKKQIVKKDNPEEEENLMESNIEKPEDGIKTGKSSKKEKAQNGSKKTSAKKPLADTEMEETNHDAGSSHAPPSKKQIVKKDNPDEDDLMESTVEKPEDGIKTGKSSKKEKAQNGSKKASAKKRLADTKMEETNHDAGSIPTPPSKKQIVTKDNSEEEDLMDSNLEKTEDGIKAGKSSKKEKAQNGSTKTSAKKPLPDTKTVKSSGKKSIHSDAKKKNSEGASMDTPSPQASKTKKKDSLAKTPATKKSEQTPKGHRKRKQTAGEEAESNTNEFGEELVGKRVNVWWPLDKAFYEGMIKSYCGRTKKHKVSYSDGDEEELNLKDERFEIIQEIDESIRLSEFVSRQKAKKSKNVSKNVEPSSSTEVSIRTKKMKDAETGSTKPAKRTKGARKAVSNEPESTEGKSSKSLKDLNDEPDKAKARTGKKKKVTPAVHRENEKDCDDKEDPETKGEDGIKLGQESDAKPDAMEEQQLPEERNAETKTDGEEEKSAKEPNAKPDAMEEQQLPEDRNADTKTDGEEEKSAKEPNAELDTDEKECNSLKEPNAEPKTDGEELDVAKEITAETKLNGEEQKVAKETNPELETDEGQRSLEETNVEPTTKGKENMSVEEPNAEPEAEIKEKESAEEENEEGMSKAKGQEIDKETDTIMPETCKEDNPRSIKELEAESDKVEVVIQVDQ